MLITSYDDVGDVGGVMAEPSIPILIFNLRWARKLRFLYPLGRAIIGKRLREELKVASLTEEPEQYGIAFLISSLLWAIIVWGITMYIVVYGQGKLPSEAMIPASIVGVFTFVVFFALHLLYPTLLAKRLADEADKKLVYLLRDLWIQSTSGVPLYIALSNVACSDYGIISEEVKGAVSKISSGERDIAVLEHLAATTRSKEFKRILWDIITSMKTGLGLTAALDRALASLTAEQSRRIKEYTSSLNFYLLLYLLFAAVIPAIFATFMSLLSVFGVLAISTETLIIVVVFSAIVQAALIGMMKASRPEISS